MSWHRSESLWPLLDEFTIRLAAMGIHDPDHMASILGLELKLCRILQSSNNWQQIILQRGSWAKNSSRADAQGRVMAVELEADPPGSAIPACYVRSADLGSLIISSRSSCAKERGGRCESIILPAAYSKRIVPSDITVSKPKQTYLGRRKSGGKAGCPFGWYRVACETSLLASSNLIFAG